MYRGGRPVFGTVNCFANKNQSGNNANVFVDLYNYLFIEIPIKKKLLNSFSIASVILVDKPI